MMCACEEQVARKFLPHQLREGTELNTQRRIDVTLGFLAGVCNTCRGVPEDAHPMASIHGRTSKILRYYWREIWFETEHRIDKWCADHGIAYSIAFRLEHKDVARRIEKEAIEEIKRQHQESPKYSFHEESQQQVLTTNQVEVVKLDGTYVKQGQEKGRLFHAGNTYSAEEFAALDFESRGYRVLETESVPFHVLFGIFLWPLIQDPDDPLVRMVGFGDRAAFERSERGPTIWAPLPEDFGTPGYSKRRAAAIEEHFETLLNRDGEGMLWTFDYWITPSEPLRQYLWAHRPNDIAKAKEIVSILSPDVVRRILRYLIADYWQHFCGWPDLLAVKEGEFLFLEVKSSQDKLSEDQKRWIKGNAAELHLPFKLVKIHRKDSIDLA